MLINSGNLSTLYRAFNAAYREGFGQAPADHVPVMMEVTSMTSEEEYGWLGQWPSLREWVGERVARSIAEHGYVVKNKKFESTVFVKRDNIEDDHYGVYAPLFNEMGRAAAAHPCELVYATLKAGFEQLCYDGQYFFDTDHPIEGASVSNDGGGSGTSWFLLDCSRMIKPIVFQRRRDYHMQHMDMLDDEQVFMREEFRYGVDARVNAGYGIWQLGYGSRQPLTADNYKAAREAMMAYKGDEGRPLGIKPTHLVVPPDLEAEALQIVNAMLGAGGATNIYYNTATLIATPWLA